MAFPSMTVEDRGRRTAELFREATSLMEDKVRDYAPGGDAFENFEAIAERVGLRREQVLLVFLEKHLHTIRCVAAGTGTSDTEPFRQRVIDAINYLAILEAMLHERALVSRLSGQ